MCKKKRRFWKVVFGCRFAPWEYLGVGISYSQKSCFRVESPVFMTLRKPVLARPAQVLDLLEIQKFYFVKELEKELLELRISV